MQAGPNLENLEASTNFAANPANLHPPTPRPIQDIDMMQNSTNSHQVESDSDAPTMTRAKSQKKKAEKLLENCPNSRPTSTQIKPTRTEEDQASQTATSNTQPGSIPRAAKTVGAAAHVESTRVQNAVRKTQEKVRLETEKRDVM